MGTKRTNFAWYCPRIEECIASCDANSGKMMMMRSFPSMLFVRKDVAHNFRVGEGEGCGAGVPESIIFPTPFNHGIFFKL